MKKVNHTTMDLVIGEDENHELHLMRRDQLESGGTFGLYLVSLTYKLDPAKSAITSNHYVLAESEDGAIGQATCGLPHEIDILPQTAIAEGKLKASVARIPVQIRGWSSTTF